MGIKHRIKATPEEICELLGLEAVTESKDGEVLGWLCGFPYLEEDSDGELFWMVNNPIAPVRNLDKVFNIQWGRNRKSWVDRISEEEDTDE